MAARRLRKESAYNHHELPTTMNSRTAGILLVCAALLATQAGAAEGPALASGKGCSKCHGVRQQKVGPPFKDIAAKYSGDPQASRKLIAFLRGDAEHARTAVSDDELRVLADYILSVK